jgi:hypothetical protein
LARLPLRRTGPTMSRMSYTPKSKEGIVKRFLEIGGVAAGVVLIAFGVAAIVMGVNGRNTVSHSLAQQKITGEPFMTPAGETANAKKAGLDIANTPIPTCSVANLPVNNGSRARCFGEYMQVDALEATHGYYYSQMGIYTAKPGTPKSQLMPGGGTDNSTYALMQSGQPVENAARNVWVTETALTTALNASYMADQTSLFGIVVGIALLLSGVGFLILALGGALENEYWFFKRLFVKKAGTPKTTPLGV